jgi:hypothetical protein
MELPVFLSAPSRTAWVTKDFSPLEKKVVENKWFAQGVGLVKSTMVKGGIDTSELESVK